MRENLKLMSVRLDPETVRKIDEFCAKHTYWKRNTVINNVLTQVFKNFCQGDIYDMVRADLFKQNMIDAKFDIKNDLKPISK